MSFWENKAIGISPLKQIGYPYFSYASYSNNVFLVPPQFQEFFLVLFLLEPALPGVSRAYFVAFLYFFPALLSVPQELFDIDAVIASAPDVVSLGHVA